MTNCCVCLFKERVLLSSCLGRGLGLVKISYITARSSFQRLSLPTMSKDHNILRVLLSVPTSVTMFVVCLLLTFLRHASRNASAFLLGRLHCGNVQLWPLLWVSGLEVCCLGLGKTVSHCKETGVTGNSIRVVQLVSARRRDSLRRFCISSWRRRLSATRIALTILLFRLRQCCTGWN